MTTKQQSPKPTVKQKLTRGERILLQVMMERSKNKKQ
jgi:hypothetical protein